MKQNAKFWLIFVNIITSLRIIGSIILFPLYFSCGAKIVGLILAFLFLTDWIDGYLARRYHVSTFFGSILDSVSDKSIAIIACTILCFLNPYMIYSIIVELAILVFSLLIITQNNTAKTLYIGKVKTWVLSLAVIIGFFICNPDKTLINICVMMPALIFEVLSLIGYLKKFFSVKVKIEKKTPKYKSFKEIKDMLFSPEFYDANKDKTGLIENIYADEK